MKIYYEYKAPQNLAEEVLQEIKKLHFSNNVYNLVGDSKKNLGYYNLNLFNFIDICLLDIKSKLFSEEINLNIISCWANKTTKGQKHHRHSHINSIMSGIFYLTSHPTGETVFYQPNPWFYLERMQIFRFSKDVSLLDLKQEVKPQKGNLVIFPSQVEHSVNENKDEEDRYTIAFNVFFSGVLGSNNISTYLKLKPNASKLF